MTRDNFVFCDLCLVPMGQFWNQPVCAPDLLPPPDFHVCDDCFVVASVDTCPQPFAQQKEGGRGQ